MITRDLPSDCDPGKPGAARWNQDRVWFSKGEARQWLPREPKPGDKHPVPQELVSRLARLHLVDTVNGQTSPFSPGQVTGSQIATEVLGREGGRVKIKITGTTKGDAQGRGRRASAHGVETRILGHAAYDLDQGAFVEFQMVALGTRWGDTELNGRRRGPEAGPPGFAVELTPARRGAGRPGVHPRLRRAVGPPAGNTVTGADPAPTIRGIQRDTGSMAGYDPCRLRPGRDDAATGVPEGPRAAVRAVRRHLYLH